MKKLLVLYLTAAAFGWSTDSVHAQIAVPMGTAPAVVGAWRRTFRCSRWARNSSFALPSACSRKAASEKSSRSPRRSQPALDDLVPLANSCRHVIAPPGTKPLRARQFSLVDVPDLRLLSLAWPKLKGIWFGAGTAPAIQHRMFVLLARLSSVHLLPFIERLAPTLHWMRSMATWGEDGAGCT